MNAGYEAKMILYFLLLGLQLQVLPSNARKSIRYCLTECHLRQSTRLNTKVYRKISQRILLTYAITQILGNGWRMCTTTPAADTRPSFFVRSVVCLSLRIFCAKNLGLGTRLVSYAKGSMDTGADTRQHTFNIMYPTT